MFCIRLAGHTLRIENHYPYTENLCRDYLTEAPPEVTISVTEEEIQREQTGSFRRSYLESLAIYRKISEYLLRDEVVLFHASAVCVDGTAYLFTAPSGTGKSTHARLWRERFHAQTINDDKPLLAVREDGVTVFGTPYGGKDGLQTNTSAPVGGIVILHQAPENSIRRISETEAYPLLLNQTHRPGDAAGMIKTLDLVKRLCDLPVYCMGCTISTEAAELAYNTLKGRNGYETER